MILNFKKYFDSFDPEFTFWDPPVIRDYGGGKIIGRPTRGFGDGVFEYAGKLMDPEPWGAEDFMIPIKKKAEKLAGTILDKDVNFTFCLCGYYSTNGEGLKHHTDTVPTEDDLVISISFGAPRLFEWREYNADIKNSTNTSEVIQALHLLDYTTENYLLEHGDALVFDGKSQMRATHGIPDIKLPAGERINMTFRSGI